MMIELYTIEQVKNMFPEDDVSIGTLHTGASLCMNSIFNYQRKKFFINNVETPLGKEEAIKKLFNAYDMVVVEWLDRKHPLYSYYDSFAYIKGCCTECVGEVDLKTIVKTYKMRAFI